MSRVTNTSFGSVISRIISTSALRSTIVQACGWNANLTPCSSVRLPTSLRFFARIFALAQLRFSGPRRRPRFAFSALMPKYAANLALAPLLSSVGLQLRCVEVLAAAGNRRDADPRLVEHFLEDLRRLLEVLLQFVAPRLDAVKAEPRRHLDAALRVRLHRREHVAAHRPAELVAGKRVQLGSHRDTEPHRDPCR